MQSLNYGTWKTHRLANNFSKENRLLGVHLVKNNTAQSMLKVIYSAVFTVQTINSNCDKSFQCVPRRGLAPNAFSAVEQFKHTYRALDSLRET